MSASQKNATPEAPAERVPDDVVDSREANDESPPEKLETPAALANLQEQLRELRERFDLTDAEISRYLKESAPGPSDGAVAPAIEQIQESINRLIAKVDQSSSSSDSEKKTGADESQNSASNQQILDALKRLADYQKDLAQKIVSSVSKRIAEELDLLRFQQIMHETLTSELDRREAEGKPDHPEQADENNGLADSDVDVPLQEVKTEEPEPENENDHSEWSKAIWGEEFSEMEGFQQYEEELNRRLLEGDAGITTLAGQIMIFRQAPNESKPQLLKDVGEAYYGTRIDELQPDHPFERDLIRWLESDCDRADLPNRIEIVHPGERFDKSRHLSRTRGGAEVSDVFGWIVLTEGGRVYTKASVATQ